MVLARDISNLASRSQAHRWYGFPAHVIFSDANELSARAADEYARVMGYGISREQRNTLQAVV